MSATVPVVAVRGSTGISLNYGPPGYDLVTSFTRDDSKGCRTMLFSADGRYFAWVNHLKIKIVSTTTWKLQSEIDRPKVSNIDFSPNGTYLITWEPFVVTASNPQGAANCHIFKSESGELVKSFEQKKQSGWEPQWSSDEKLCARLVNSEVHFYENSNFDTVVHKLNVGKVSSFSMSPGTTQNHILCYLPGSKAQPSFGRLFQYPKFDNASSLANKGFYQGDKVEMFWNKKGTEVLMMMSTEVDKTGSSYYGKQTLCFISTKGETSMVLLSKNGPVYSVEWSPKSTEFCVIYGFMEAKATLFNLKCEPVFEFGEGSRNCIHFNPHGNILILGGFGNLGGSVEIWDVTNKKLISKVGAPDTTLLKWSPDGVHFLTATTAPRLRQGNGFKIWHYSGSLLYERPWSKVEELWEVAWQTYPPDTFKEPHISNKVVEGIQPSQPQASKQVYRPPSARGKESGFKLHDDDNRGSMPKINSKSKTKTEARKAKKESVTGGGGGGGEPKQNQSTTATKTNTESTTRATDAGGNVNHDANSPDPSNGVCDDPEKMKKMKKLKSKLAEIGRLKEQKDSGKQLELNQMEKIKKEDEIRKELNELLL